MSLREPNSDGKYPDGEDQGPGVVRATERIADQLDAMVPVSEDAGNQVLTDDTKLVRWTAPLFVACAVVLLPWIVIAGLTLPQRQLSRNYDIAWAGYDVILLIGLTCTGFTALRRSRRLPIAASATGALLTADAWFDVLTSPGGWGVAEAVAMSILAELPLAAICFWLAWHSQEFAEHRLVLLTRRQRRQRAEAVPVET
jgi:hypothetical protein